MNVPCLLARLFAILIVAAALTAPAAAQVVGFKPDPNGEVRTAVQLADGRVLIGGDFTVVDGIAAVGLARLHADGRIDTTFSAGIDSGRVYAIAVEPDGYLVIGGSFTSIGGVARGRIARLGADGALDPAFAPQADDTVRLIHRQADGRLLIGGHFTRIDGVPQGRLARLTATGMRDATFTTAADGFVFAAVPQSDGALVIGGAFTTVDGQPHRALARLRADGRRDAAFDAQADGTVQALASTAEGLIYAGGAFTTIDGVARRHLARLRTDGSVDPAFRRDTDSAVLALALQADGRLLLGGSFGQVDGQARTRLARLAVDGSVDAEFRPQPGNNVTLLRELADGQLLVGGPFGQFGVWTRARLARLYPAGVLDDDIAVAIDDGVRAIAPMPDRRLLVSGPRRYVGQLTGSPARLGVDGAPDLAYAPNIENAVVSLVVDAAATRILGSFEVIAGQDCRRLARLRDDGTLDTAFSGCALGGDVSIGIPLADGGLLAGGTFTEVSGHTRRGLARFAANGGLIAGFAPQADGAVVAAAEQPDGRIVVAGFFDAIDGQPRDGLARVHADGTLDAAFAPQVGEGAVTAVVATPDGALIVAGDFARIDGQPRALVARLRADGSLDAGFVPAIVADGVGYVSSIALQADGRIAIGGRFRLAGQSGAVDVAMLRADGSVDPGFGAGTPSAESGALTIQADGKLAFDVFTASGARRIARAGQRTAALQRLAVEDGTVRWMRGGASPELGGPPLLSVSTGGTSFSAIGPMQRIAGGWALPGFRAPVGQPYFLRVQGRTRGGVGNGAAGLVETTVRLFRPDRIFRHDFD